MSRLLDRLVPLDFPFFGACYGVATLGLHQGGIVDTTFGETVSAPAITLTEAGRAHPAAWPHAASPAAMSDAATEAFVT